MTHHAPQNNNTANKIVACISIIVAVFLVLFAIIYSFSGDWTSIFGLNKTDKNTSLTNSNNHGSKNADFNNASNDDVTDNDFGNDKVITKDSLSNPEDKKIYDSLNCEILINNGNTLPIFIFFYLLKLLPLSDSLSR